MRNCIMTIYQGEISHQGNRSHPAGTTRTLRGGTDDYNLALAFGTSGSTGRVSSNNKLQVIDLFRDGDEPSIFIDPSEVLRIDEIKFIQSNIGMVADWNALTRYMLNEHQAELTITLRQIDPTAHLNELTNQALEALTRLFFNVSDGSDVAKEISLSREQPSVVEIDTIQRNFNNKARPFHFDTWGMSVHGVIKQTRFELRGGQLILNYKFENVTIDGSKSRITRVEDGKSQKAQFEYFKRKAVAYDGEKRVKFHDYETPIGNNRLQVISSRVIDFSNDDFKTIVDELAHAFQNADPAEAGLEDFDNFNI